MGPCAVDTCVGATFQLGGGGLPSTQDVPIIAERLDEGSVNRHLLIARWGLVPSWANLKIGSELINARSESILEKPSFRKAAVKRRALIPAYL